MCSMFNVSRLLNAQVMQAILINILGEKGSHWRILIAQEIVFVMTMF